MNRFIILFIGFIQCVYSQNDLQKQNLNGKVQTINLSYQLNENNKEAEIFFRGFIKKYIPFNCSYNSKMIADDRSEDYESNFNVFQEFDENGSLKSILSCEFNFKKLETDKEKTLLIHHETPKELTGVIFPQYLPFLRNKPISKPNKISFKIGNEKYDQNPNFALYFVNKEKLLTIKEFDTLGSAGEVKDTINKVETHFIYDKNSNVISRTKVYIDPSKDKKKMSEYFYFYNSNNQVYKYQNFKNKKFIEEEFYFYENNKCILIENHYCDNEVDQFYFTCKTLFHLDSFGNIIKIEFYDNDFGIQLLHFFRFDYQYDSYNNWVKSTFYSDESKEPLAIFSREILYYK